MSMPLDASVYTDMRGLTSLRAEARKDGQSEETLRKVASQFESIFINQVLKNMRATSLDEGGLMDSEQVRFYQSMFDQQLAQEMTRGQGLGLADLLVEQLRQKTPDADSEQPSGPFPLTGRDQLPWQANRPAAAASMPLGSTAAPAPLSAPAPAATERDESWRPDSPEDFVQDLWPHAERAARKLGTQPEVLLAQAALESGWGRHMMQHADGRGAHNLFGIKADDRWDGERVAQKTLEFRDGVMQREQATFRAYASPAESFADYVKFIRENPRYQDALASSGNGREYLAGLQQAGYATDPEYSSKINKIMDSSVFREAVRELKQTAARPLASLEDSVAGKRQLQSVEAVVNHGGGV